MGKFIPIVFFIAHLYFDKESIVKTNKKNRFYDEMKECLMRLKPEEMEISFNRINKQNRKGLHGCILQLPGAAASPTFYFEDLYEAYLNGTAPEDIAESLINFARENNLDSIPGNIDIDDYDCVRKNLGLMVIGEEKNREYLEDMIYKKIEDLALIPIIFTNDKYGTGCIKVREGFLKYWGVSAGEVLEEAILNAPRIMPPTFRQLNEILGSQDEDDNELFVISNSYYAGGAAVAFYPGFLDCIGKALGKDLFILPSSVNELILVTDSGQDPEVLLQIVKEVNRTQVEPGEVLTDAVYHYSRSGEGFQRLLPSQM